MMILTRYKSVFDKNKTLAIHSLIGMLIGYFILHPVSMVIHWTEMSTTGVTIFNLSKVLLDNIIHSFSLHMMPMSIAFAILGLLMGLGSGLYSISIQRKEVLLYGKHQLLQQSIPGLIHGGENEFVEFKSSLRYAYREQKIDRKLEQVILKTIAGFLNAQGGVLVIGVDDDGEILGLENDYLSLKKQNKDGFQQLIIQLVSSSFGKDVLPRIHITFHLIEEKEICTLYVEPSAKPVYVNDGNRTVFYLRTGNVTNPLTTSETVEYIQSNKNPRYIKK